MSISSSINTLPLKGILKKTNPPIEEVQNLETKSEKKINQFFGEKVDVTTFSHSEVKTTQSFKKRFGNSFKRRLSKKASKEKSEVNTSSNLNSSTQSEDSKVKKSQKKVTFQIEKVELPPGYVPPGYVYMKPAMPSKPVPSSILVRQWIKQKDQRFRYAHSFYVYMSTPVYQNLGSESFKEGRSIDPVKNWNLNSEVLI